MASKNYNGNDKSDNNLMTVYTDGSATGKVGPGAYALVFLPENNQPMQYQSKMFSSVTNNQMELGAVVSALRICEKNYKNYKQIKICSDSEYVVKNYNDGWVDKWVKNNFNKGSKKEIKNIPLWEQFICLKKMLQEGGVQVEFEHVAGHAGILYNELCDTLAVEARTQEFAEARWLAVEGGQ